MSEHSLEVDPGFEIKHRIVGALVLISAAIIIVPEILQEPDPAGSTASTQAARSLGPKQEVEGFVSTITPIARQAASSNPSLSSKSKVKQPTANIDKAASPENKTKARPQPELEVIPLKTTKLEKPKPIESDKRAVSTKKSTVVSSRKPNNASSKTKSAKVPPPPKAKTKKTTKKPKSKPIPTVAAISTPAIERGWEIRIGTFAQPENAERIMATLRKHGFSPRRKKIATKKGPVTRVSVGPFATRVTAGRTRALIEAKTKQKGWITPYPK